MKYRFSRSSIRFPVGTNVPAVLSHCHYDDKRKSIVVTHKTLIDDPRIKVGGRDKRGDGKMWIKKNSNIYVPVEWSKSDWDTFDRHVEHVCRVLGINTTTIRQKDREERIPLYTQAIFNKVGEEYYLKTVVDISNRGYVNVYASRKVPFMSKTDDLFYIDGEDELNDLFEKRKR